MPTLNLTDADMVDLLDLHAWRSAKRILDTFTHFYALQPGTVDWPTFKRLYRIAIDMAFDVCFMMTTDNVEDTSLGLTSDRRAEQINTHLRHFLDGDHALIGRLIESDVMHVAGFELDLDQWETVLRDIHAKCVAKSHDLIKEFRNDPTYDTIFPAMPTI